MDDFLEISWFLTAPEREFLIDQIRESGEAAENIRACRAFFVSGKLIAAFDREPIRELWIYDSAEKKVRRFRLEEVP